MASEITRDEDDGMQAVEENIINPETDEDFLNIYKMRDIDDFVQLILQRFANLTIYIVEPAMEPREGEPLKIPANEDYTIHDYGNRIVIAANDLFNVPLFSTTAFFAAIYQGLELLLEADVQEAALLGDPRAKHYLWDICERKKAAKTKQLNLINFSVPAGFDATREAVLRYFKINNMTPAIHSLKPPKR